MTWTPPHTFVPNTMASADEVNENFADLATYVDEGGDLSAVKYAKVTATPTLVQNTPTAVTWTSGDERGGDFWSAGSNPTRVTVAEDGLYMVHSYIAPVVATATVRIRVRINGTDVLCIGESGTDRAASASGVTLLDGGDYLETQVDTSVNTSPTSAVSLTVAKIPVVV